VLIVITKDKVKIGKIDRIVDANNIHVKDLFSKETNPDIFYNLKVYLTLPNIQGTITGTFGKSGKIKVRLDNPCDLPED
jgi:hypothetical protein